MVDYQVVLDVLPAVSIMIGVAYYIMVLRNQEKARQAQLVINLHQYYRSLEFRKMCQDIREQTWSSFEDFWTKYGEETNSESWNKWESVSAFYNGIGVLLQNNLIDVKLVYELFYNVVARDWTIMGPVLIEWRTFIDKRHFKLEGPERFGGFDYLYGRLEQYRKTQT